MATTFPATQAAGKADVPCFFVVGPPRGGTTMLRLLLNSHPEVCVPPETVFFPFLLRNAESYGDFGTRERIEAFARDVAAASAETGQTVATVFSTSPEEIAAAVEAAKVSCYAEAFAAFMGLVAGRQEKRVWGDKTPFYTAFIEVLAQCFPNARFIALVRDPRDVAESLHRTEWGRKWYPSLLDAGMRWRYAIMAIERAAPRLGPERLLAVRYEDLVADPERWARDICSFLHLDFDERMLRFHETATREVPEGSKAWHQSTLEPISGSRIGRWKQRYSPEEIGLIEIACKPEMRRWGYEPEGRSLTPANLGRLASWQLSYLRGRIAWTYWNKPRSA